MPDFSFTVERAESVAYAAVPQLAFKLKISQRGEGLRESIQAIALRCQIRIEPTKRRYNERAQEKLADIYGSPDRWRQTLRSMLWTHTGTIVPTFTDSIVIDLPVPCSFDFNLATTKYFAGLDEGEIPLSLLFSGTVFYKSEEAGLQIAQVPWDCEATYRLPVETWRAMMDHYYPNSAFLCLRREVFDALATYKRKNSLPTWEQAMELLLENRADKPDAVATEATT